MSHSRMQNTRCAHRVSIRLQPMSHGNTLLDDPVAVMMQPCGLWMGRICLLHRRKLKAVSQMVNNSSPCVRYRSKMTSRRLPFPAAWRLPLVALIIAREYSHIDNTKLQSTYTTRIARLISSQTLSCDQHALEEQPTPPSAAHRVSRCAPAEYYAYKCMHMTNGTMRRLQLPLRDCKSAPPTSAPR